MTLRLPPLNALRAFDAAARHMSFRLAAAEFNVTPAALSYQIRQLEETLGVKLFVRLNRAVELTEFGALIAPGVGEAFQQLGRTMQLLDRRRSTNVLTISAGPGTIAKWLSPRLYRFIALHPDIDVRISANFNLVDLAVDDVDVAIRFGAGTYDGLYSQKLSDEFVTPLCSPALANGPPALKQPKDLDGMTFIHDEGYRGHFSLPDWTDWLHAAGVTGIDPTSGGLHFNIGDAAIDAAAASAGVVLGRIFMAQADIDAGRLIAPFDLKLPVEWSFYVVCLETRVGDPVVRAVLDWLADEAIGNITEPSATMPV